MTDLNPMLVASLKEVRRKFDAKDDDWRYSLLRTFREFLKSEEIERRLIDPIQHFLLDEAQRVDRERAQTEGRKVPRAKITTVAPIAYATAAVDYLKSKHKISHEEAIRKVSRASGFKRSELKTFRDRLSRGGDQVAQMAPSSHDEALAEFHAHSYSVAATLEFVGDTAQYCR